ncbi:Zn-ribbon domain-containing OB-fold protein [Verrucomicrobiota bacterium]
MSVKLLKSEVDIFSESPLVIKNPKACYHIHTYGGLSIFFKGLAEGKLMGTRCTNSACEEERIWLPPRVDCPDCFEKMEWVEAPQAGKIYTHSTVLYPGNGFRLSTPCPLISVEIEGVCTKLMSYLKEGEPAVGLPIKAVFNTEEPTYTILDLAWVPL